MPRIKSAKKRMRQELKRAGRNRTRKERLKKAVKTYRSILAKGEIAVMAEGLSKVHKAVDKAGTKGIIHKNTVNRRKSRLAKEMNRIKAAKTV